MTAIARRALDMAEARLLTEEVKSDAAALWSKLLALYEGGAHTALGYASWADYCAGEFDMGRSRAYQLLDAGRIAVVIDAQSTMVDSPPEAQSTMVDSPDQEAVDARASTGKRRLPLPGNERVARRLLQTAERNPDRAAAIWEATVDRFGPDATAAQVAETAAQVDAEPRDVPLDTAAVVRELRRGAAAALKAHKTRDPGDARRALAILRAAGRQLPAECKLLDAIAKGGD